MGIEQSFVENKRVLVLGVGGMIGRGLAHVLSKNNEVHGLDCFPRPEVKQEVAQCCERLYEVDASQPGCLRDVPRDFDAVFNELVVWGHGTELNWDAFTALMLVNSLFPGQVMEHFAGTDARLVFGSTGGCYVACKDKNDPHREGVTLSEGGAHPYDDTKLGGEIIVHYFSRAHGTPAIILRYYWPVAPWTGGGRAGSTYSAWKEGKPTRVSPKNPWYHNVGYASDLIYGTIAAAGKVGCPPPLYNISGKDVSSYYDVDLAVAEAMGIEPIFEEVERERDMDIYIGSVEKMAQNLWQPRIGLQEVVRRVIRGVEEEARSPQDWMFESAGGQAS